LAPGRASRDLRLASSRTMPMMLVIVRFVRITLLGLEHAWSTGARLTALYCVELHSITSVAMGLTWC
jgi:hypothetical protein